MHVFHNLTLKIFFKDITVVQVFQFFDSTLLHVAALHFMWPLGDCKAPVLSFLLHAHSQTAYFAYSAQLLWRGLFIPPVNVHEVLRSSTAANSFFMLVKNTHLIMWKLYSVVMPCLKLCPSFFLGNRITFMSINKRINYHWKALLGDFQLDLLKRPRHFPAELF